MTTALTKQDLRVIHQMVARDPNGAAIAEKIRTMLAERAGAHEAGPLVFRIELPLRIEGRSKLTGKVVHMDLAPSMNVYSALAPWARDRLRKQLDMRILAELGRWPNARPKVVPRRLVHATRHSTRPIDEISVDTLGGKCLLDRLVHAGILAGDSAKEIDRQAAWIKAAPGRGKLVVEVHELICEESST